jgi:hypothetical protein
MPVSSHILINIGPRDTPVDRMKISKQPTVETMGNQDNQTLGSSLPVRPACQGTSSSLAITSSLEAVPEEDLGRRPYHLLILIIKDNPVNLQILIIYITKQG